MRATGRGNKRTTGEVADRCDVQEVVIPRRQVNEDSIHLHRIFGVAKSAATSRSKRWGDCHSAGNEGATGAGEDTLPDSQVAPVMLVSVRLLEKTDTTSQPA